MAKLTLSQIRLIKYEALITLQDKAAKEIAADRAKVEGVNSLVINSAVESALSDPYVKVRLKEAVIASVSVVNGEVEMSRYSDSALNKYLRSAISKCIRKGALKDSEDIVRVARIFNPTRRSSYPESDIYVLKSREAKYKPIVDEIEGLELQFALGADAAKVLASIKAKIAKL